MRKFKKVTTETDVLDKVICDVCKKEFDPEKDHQEVQEFTRICFEGGYSSIFGDGNFVECDICQHCLQMKLGDNLRITDGENETQNQD